MGSRRTHLGEGEVGTTQVHELVCWIEDPGPINDIVGLQQERITLRGLRLSPGFGDIDVRELAQQLYACEGLLVSDILRHLLACRLQNELVALFEFALQEWHAMVEDPTDIPQMHM